MSEIFEPKDNVVTYGCGSIDSREAVSIARAILLGG